MLIASSVQFSSRWYLYAQTSPYVLHPICQKFPAGRDQVRHSEVRWTCSLLLVCSSVQDGICMLRQAHMCSTPSVRSFLLAQISEVRWTWSLLLVYSSVLFKMVSMHWEKPICAPPCLSEVSCWRRSGGILRGEVDRVITSNVQFSSRLYVHSEKPICTPFRLRSFPNTAFETV